MIKMDIEVTTVSIKNCIGKEIIDDAGNKLGILKDFLISVDKSYAPFAVISEGGSFNPAIQESYMALPLNVINFENPEVDQLKLNVSAKKLDDVPRVSKAKFRNMNIDFLKEVEIYYGLKENFTPSHGSENKTEEHQDYEGSAENSDHESVDYNSLGDEVNFDKIKGIDRKET